MNFTCLFGNHMFVQMGIFLAVSYFGQTIMISQLVLAIAAAMRDWSLAPRPATAGAALGPFGLGALSGDYPWLQALTFANEKDLAAFAELGVVFLLFVIGLELSVERLRTMRRLVFGLGSLQVAISPSPARNSASVTPRSEKYSGGGAGAKSPGSAVKWINAMSCR